MANVKSRPQHNRKPGAQRVQVQPAPKGDTWINDANRQAVPDDTINARSSPPDPQAIKHDEVPTLGDDIHSVEMSWLQRHLAELQQECPGDWVAIGGHKLVAHARDLSTLLQLVGHLSWTCAFVELRQSA